MLDLLKLKMLIFDILFSPLCVGCKSALKSEEKNKAICSACSSKIVIHNTLFCGTCRARLPENKKICHKNSPYLLGAATDYDDTIRALIHQLKYRGWTRLSGIFKEIFEMYIKNTRLRENMGTFLKNCVIIPVPLHQNRKKERGFNQSELLSELISKILILPVVGNILLRVKETKSQAELSGWERRKINMEKSFVVSCSEKIIGKNIILVDDVYTSGATANEAVKTLKESGAKRIIVLVTAKVK